MNEDTRQTNVQTVEKPGATPAKRRIASADAASAIYQRCKTFDDLEAQRRASIQGMVDGNPPHNPKVMEDMGLGDMTNVNFGGMAAKLDQRAAAAHELFAEIPTLIELNLLIPDPKDRASEDWAMTIAEEFTQTILDEPSFLIMHDLVFREADKFGIGYATFCDKWDFIPEGHDRGTLLIDPQAPIDVDDNEVFIIRDTMSAGELFKIVEKGEVAAEVGWNAEAIKRVLLKVFAEGNNGNTEETYQTSTWEEVLTRSRTNDAQFQAREFQQVRILRFLVREVSGDQKISMMILAEADVGTPSNTSQSGSGKTAPKLEFLYESSDCYEEMSQAIWWLPFKYSKYARSVRGIASQMFKHEDLSNRLLCSAFDATFLRTSVVMQSATQIDLSKLQLVRHGFLTVLPSGLNSVQTSFQPDVSSAIEIRRVSESIMENNTGLTHRYPESLTADSEARKTARQVAEESTKEARTEKAQVAHRYNQYERLYREMFRRLTSKSYLESADESLPRLKAAQAFVDRCVKRNVPREFVVDGFKKWRVTATRAIGLGSYGVKMDIANQLVNKMPLLSDRGRRNALRFWASTMVGQRNTNTYVEPLNKVQTPTQEMSFAVAEDGILALGSPALAAGDQLHEVHIQSHAKNVVMPIVQGVQQQKVGDPMKAFAALRAALQHISAHLQYWKGQPGMKEKIAEIEKLMQAGGMALRQLEQMIKQIQAEKQRQQEQAQKAQLEQQRRLALAEAEVQQMRMDTQLEWRKQESMNQMRIDKTAEQNRIRAQGAQLDMDLKASRQAHELQLDAIEMQAKLDLERAEAAAGQE